MLFLFLSICSFSAYFLTRNAAKFNDAPVLHVSTASVDILPKEPVFLSGFLTRQEPPTSTALLTPFAPLRARVLVLRFPPSTEPHATTRLVLITFDLIGIDRALSDSIFNALLRHYSLSRREVRLVFSHTHSGPAVGANLRALVSPGDVERAKISRYASHLVSSVTDLVGAALSPTRIAAVRAYFGVGASSLAVNRRQVEERLFSGRSGVRGDTDQQLPVMWFRRVDGSDEIVAGMYGFAAHATVLTSSALYSGDYPSAVSVALEAEHPGSTWFFLPGCGGDLNIYPRGSVALLESHRDALVYAVRNVVATESETEPVFLEDARDALAMHEWVRLRFRATFSLGQLRKLARSEPSTSARTAATLMRSLAAGQRTDAAYDLPMSAWSIGRVKIIFLGGEPTVDYAFRIREEADASWVVGYTDDVMGYVGTAHILEEGKREGSDRAAQYYGLPCAWDTGVEETIMDHVKKLSGFDYTENTTRVE